MKFLKFLKIAQYLLSVIHLTAQIFYFFQWNATLELVQKMSTRIDAITLSNASLTLSIQSFTFLFMAFVTLTLYVTISHHIGLWLHEMVIQEHNNSTEPKESEKEK